MPVKDNDKKQVRCSFCGKTQEEVVQLVEGPGVYICDSCITFCNTLLYGEAEENKPRRKANDKKAEEFILPTPKEIKEKLDEYVIGRMMLKSPCLLLCIITISVYLKKLMT